MGGAGSVECLSGETQGESLPALQRNMLRAQPYICTELGLNEVRVGDPGVIVILQYATR